MEENFLKNTWKKIIYLAENLEKVSDVFLYLKNWEKKENNEIPELTEKNFKFYVWASREDEEKQFYSEEFYIESIKKFLKEIPKKSKITISIWADFKKFFNNNDIKNDNWMSSTEQYWYIKWLINNNLKNYKKRIILESIWDNHKELFKKLWENIHIKPEDFLDNIPEKFNSLDIYNLLYQATKSENKAFFKTIAYTRPESNSIISKDLDSDKNYYALAEIAFRITDYLNWIEFQWWERRQQQYDKIILDILSWWYNYYPEIKKVYDFIKNKKSKQNFNSLYFSKNKFEKEKARKKIRNFILKTILWVSLIIWWPVAWYKYNQYQTEQKIQTRLDKLKQDEINQIWWANIDWIVENIQKNQKFEKKVLKYFIWKYWLWDFENKNDLLIVLRDWINNYKTQELSEMIREKYPNFNNKQEEFLYQFNKIVDSIKNTLTLNWINLVSPLWKFEDFSEEINNTLNADIQQIQFLWKQFISDIEKVTLANWKEVDIWIIRCKQQWASPWTNYSICKWIKWEKSFFWARYKWTNTKFSLELAQKVIKEFKK